MEIFLLIVYVLSIYYGLKIFMLLFSCLIYVIMKFKVKNIKIEGILNSSDTKGMILLVIPIIDKMHISKDIVTHYKNIITGYKRVNVVFITCEKEEIEIKLKHNDEKSTRDILMPQIEEANKKLDRSEAIKLIHYPYDDDNKSHMIEYAVKEFMQNHISLEKMTSYIGIFDSSSMPDEELISMLEKTFKKYKYPKILELVNIKSLLLDKKFNAKSNKFKSAKNSDKNAKWLIYLYNLKKTINEFIKVNFRNVARKVLFMNKLLPYDLNLDGSFIRFDLFYEEEMFGMCQMQEVVGVNYYFKDAKKETLYVFNNTKVITEENQISTYIENEFTYLHLLKKQCQKINKYRLPNKLKTFIVGSLANIKMTFKFLTSYLMILSIATLIFAKQINLRSIIFITLLLYGFAILEVIIYEILMNNVRFELKYKNSLVTKIISIIMYPLYLLYESNGCYDYIKNRAKVNKVDLSHTNEIR